MAHGKAIRVRRPEDARVVLGKSIVDLSSRLLKNPRPPQWVVLRRAAVPPPVVVGPTFSAAC
jgi:hypothetical protein